MFYCKSNQWASCVFLCILLEPEHFTSDKSPWQYFVLSKSEANIHILTHREISFFSLPSSQATASLFTVLTSDISLHRRPGGGEGIRLYKSTEREKLTSPPASSLHFVVGQVPRDQRAPGLAD